MLCRACTAKGFLGVKFPVQRNCGGCECDILAKYRAVGRIYKHAKLGDVTVLGYVRHCYIEREDGVRLDVHAPIHQCMGADNGAMVKVSAKNIISIVPVEELKSF